MNENEIESFLAVIRNGNISNASKNLYISQSTISQRIKTLEDKLGVKLIERNKGKSSIRLTHSGDNFYKIAIKWEQLLKDAKMLKQEEVSQQISIGAIDSIHNFVMSDVYLSLITQNEDVIYFFRTHQSYELYSLLENNAIDVGLLQQEKTTDKLIKESLFTEELVLAVNPKYDERIKDVTELASEKEIYFDWGYDYRMWHEKKFGYEGTLGVEVDTGLLFQKLLSLEGYWGMVPVSIAKQYSKHNKLSIYKFDGNSPCRTCYLVYEKNNTRIFDTINYIRECIETITDMITLDEKIITGNIKS